MAKIPFSYIVCECEKVTLGEIVYALDEKGAKTLEDLEKLTNAGAICKSCKRLQDDFRDPKLKLHLDEILKKIGNR